MLLTTSSLIFKQQESIPVGYVPPACTVCFSNSQQISALGGSQVNKFEQVSSLVCIMVIVTWDPSFPRTDRHTYVKTLLSLAGGNKLFTCSNWVLVVSCLICTTHLAHLDIALIVHNFLSQNNKQEISLLIRTFYLAFLKFELSRFSCSRCDFY